MAVFEKVVACPVTCNQEHAVSKVGQTPGGALYLDSGAVVGREKIFPGDQRDIASTAIVIRKTITMVGLAVSFGGRRERCGVSWAAPGRSEARQETGRSAYEEVV
jgi:hypothetical protein